MKQIEALKAVSEAGGKVWMGMMMRGQHSGIRGGSRGDTLIPAAVWNRLVETGDLDIEIEDFRPSSKAHLFLTEKGRQRLEREHDL